MISPMLDIVKPAKVDPGLPLLALLATAALALRRRVMMLVRK